MVFRAGLGFIDTPAGKLHEFVVYSNSCAMPKYFVLIMLRNARVVVLSHFLRRETRSRGEKWAD